MKKTNAVSGVLAIFVTMPIWFYLLHEILEAVNATEFMWFLYWVYVPAVLLASVLAKLSD